MTVRFKGVLIPGTHGDVIVQPPRPQIVRTYFWGLRGETEIVGGVAGRELSISIWVHNNYRYKNQIDDELDSIDKMVTEHGDLSITLPVPAGASKKPKPLTTVYRQCTFEGFMRTPLGATQGAPIPDYAGTVDGGWFCPGELRFYQLTVASSAAGSSISAGA